MPDSDSDQPPRPPRPLRLVGLAGDLVPVRREPPRPLPPVIPTLPTIALADLYGALLADSPVTNTRAARKYDVELFRRWLDAPDPAAACAALVADGRGMCNAIGCAFRAHELGRGLAPSSVNRSLATLRKLTVLARRFDLIEWTCDIPIVSDRHIPDRRGPSVENWRLLWAAAVADGDGTIARRDRSIIILLRDSAVRKGELVALNYPEDFDPARPGLYITGKGHSRRAALTINRPSAAAMLDWLEVRGDVPGPMYLAKVRGPHSERLAGATSAGPVPARASALRAEGLDALAVAAALDFEGYRRPDGMPWTIDDVCPADEPVGARRICERSINAMLHRLAKRAGVTVPVRPHGLRHAGITRALDLTNGDVRKVARFARHANVNTTMAYDDDRTDLAGVVARLLGDDGND